MNNYDGYTETQAQQDARAARITAWVEQTKIRDEMIAEVAPMLEVLQSAVAGTFIVDEIGVDAVDADRWQDAPEYKEAQKVSDNFNFDTVAEQEF